MGSGESVGLLYPVLFCVQLLLCFPLLRVLQWVAVVVLPFLACLPLPGPGCCFGFWVLLFAFAFASGVVCRAFPCPLDRFSGSVCCCLASLFGLSLVGSVVSVSLILFFFFCFR